jgi:hypothetical protein
MGGFTAAAQAEQRFFGSFFLKELLSFSVVTFCHIPSARQGNKLPL